MLTSCKLQRILNNWDTISKTFRTQSENKVKKEVFEKPFDQFYN